MVFLDDDGDVILNEIDRNSYKPLMRKAGVCYKC